MVPSRRVRSLLCITGEVVLEEVDAAFDFGQGSSGLHDSSDKDLCVGVHVLGAGGVDREEPVCVV